MLPYEHIELLIWDKFSRRVTMENFEEVKRSIDEEEELLRTFIELQGKLKILNIFLMQI